MGSESSGTGNQIGRRAFLRSFFGLGGGILQPADAADAIEIAEAKSAANAPAIFVWAGLKTGFIGFPTGLRVEAGLPGSTMKIVAAAAITEEGLVNPNDEVTCNGHIKFGRRTFNCIHAHGRVNLVEALAHSCNVYFATVSERLSAQMFLEYAKRFGLDSAVGKVSAGPFPDKVQDPVVDYVLGLSPHLKPNALQLLRMSALVATHGRPPYLHSAEESAEGKTALRLDLREGTWSRITNGMRQCVREGTAAKLDPENHLNLAAKTGTAPHGKKFQSWLIGYFPYDSPKHAFCLGAPVGTSQESAVPKAKEFLFATKWPE